MSKRMETFLEEILNSHNTYREHHHVPPLRLSRDLTEGAQAWAETIAKNDKLEHDPECQEAKLGENVAMKYSSVHSDFPGNIFTDYWYREIEDYDFDDVQDQIQCGHFTQVVWKATEEVGFGRAVSASGRVYVVGRYRPAGNYMGEFCKNVLPPVDGKIVLPDLEQNRKSATIPGAKLEAVIGPNDPKDQLVGTRISTRTVGNKKTVINVETYKTPEGNTYTKERETTTTVE